MSAAFPLLSVYATEAVHAETQSSDALHYPSDELIAPKPELAFYRKYTEAMLRRYARLSLRSGRMPALLGHDAFRGRMSTYRVTSFEDSVIFVHDMEKCLKMLDGFSAQLVRRIALQEYTQGEAAGLLGVSLRTVVRKYGEAVDRLTEILIDRRLLEIDRLEGAS